MKSTKKGREFYIELIKPMRWLAEKNRKMGVRKISEIRDRKLKTIRDMIKRSKNIKVIVEKED